MTTTIAIIVGVSIFAIIIATVITFRTGGDPRLVIAALGLGVICGSCQLLYVYRIEQNWLLSVIVLSDALVIAVVGKMLQRRAEYGRRRMEEFERSRGLRE